MPPIELFFCCILLAGVLRLILGGNVKIALVLGVVCIGVKGFFFGLLFLLLLCESVENAACRQCDQHDYAELSGSVTMRAFSSQCFHDTKYFERNVRELFLTIARKYNTQLAAACTEAELGERDQLAFLGIYARPELYELSGDCAICLKKGELQLGAAEPYGLALPSTLVSEIVDIELKNICCMTFIENKTNYDEYLLAEKQPEELVVYHGGFLSPQKKKLFEKLAAAAGETMQIRFWADIDLGGFCMFENLQTVFPQLEPMRMEGRFVEQCHKNGLKRPEQYLKKLKEERNAGRHTLFVDAIDKILQ